MIMITNKVKNKNSTLSLNFTQANNKYLEGNQSLIPDNNLQRLSIDRRILPLFRIPILRQKFQEIEENNKNYILNKSSSNLLLNERVGLHSHTNLNKKLTNQVLKLFIKGIILYNLNLKSFLLHENKLNLILNIKNDKIYKLDTKISIFFNRVNKLFFLDTKIVLPKININKRKSITKKSDTLFVSYLKKGMYNIQTPLRNRKDIFTDIGFRKALFIHKISRKRISNNIVNNKDLIELGKEIINDLDYQIAQYKLLINKINNNNKVLDLLRNTSLLYLDTNINNKNSNFNYNLINSNVKDSEQLNYTTSNQSVDRSGEMNYKNLVINKIFKSVNKTNKIQIEHTINSIIENKEFNYKTESISIDSNPISIVYGNTALADNNNSKYPIINKYLKAISKYNIPKNGISIYYSNIIGYAFNNETNKLIKDIYHLLAYSFKSMYCLISKPVLVFTSNKIIIQLFYYLFIPNIMKSKKIYNLKNKRRKNLRFDLTWKKRRRKIKLLYRKFRKFNINSRVKLRKLYLFNITKIFPDKFKKLCEILSNLFKKPVELDLIRLHYPYNDSNILANFLAIMINRIKLRIIAKKLFGKAVLKNKKFSSTKTNKFNNIPAYLSGINIKVAGRLLNNKIVPRKTVKTIKRGAVATGKINYLDVAKYTNKNKRGAYSITVSSGQKFF
uniref:Small ribosomal subunit protein uS3m n=1 Tax=Amanita pseudoporphyria TaxID=67725 RepID=A0A5Q0N1Y5_9AGAR|nr:ribosomal protein S3 [Amanita pseudoporphyria]QFZ98504.1 ribosomal protein S3 [Amanita pseudoporphyria]